MIYNSETGYCEDPDMGIYCTTTNGAYYQNCYQKDTDKRCELRTSLNIVKQGSCTDPGCPTGFEYQYIAARDIFGCQETGKATNEGMACIYDTGGIQCLYNGIQCGIGCDYDGTDCSSVYLPQCALAGHCPQTGYDMSDGCTCDGNVTSVDGMDYCCPAGHTYVNGACTMTG